MLEMVVAETQKIRGSVAELRCVPEGIGKGEHLYDSRNVFFPPREHSS